MITQKEYNAMLHALWRLDAMLKDLDTADPNYERLSGERSTLSNLFNRLADRR